MDYHRITPDGAILIHSDDMKSQAQIDEERKQFILSRKPLAPTGFCRYCGWSVPKLALWCATACAQEFAEEKERLIR